MPISACTQQHLVVAHYTMLPLSPGNDLLRLYVQQTVAPAEYSLRVGTARKSPYGGREGSSHENHVFISRRATFWVECMVPPLVLTEKGRCWKKHECRATAVPSAEQSISASSDCRSGAASQRIGSHYLFAPRCCRARDTLTLGQFRQPHHEALVKSVQYCRVARPVPRSVRGPSLSGTPSLC